MNLQPDPFLPFTPVEAIQRDIGKGNALFLGDLANGASASTLRTNWKAGKYPELNPAYAREWIREAA